MLTLGILIFTGNGSVATTRLAFTGSIAFPAIVISLFIVLGPTQTVGNIINYGSQFPTAVAFVAGTISDRVRMKKALANIRLVAIRAALSLRHLFVPPTA
jgi:hypothetical protein